MKKSMILVMVLTLSVVMLFTGCGGNDKKAETETFIVGLEAGYAPFNWTQKDASNGAVKIDKSPEYAGGYDVEIAKKIAEGLGKELVIVKTEWDGLVPALISKKIDGIIAGMSPTAERKETIDFSDNYYKSDLIMVVKKGGEYEKATQLSDFSGATVTAQLNTFHYSVISQIEGVNKEVAMDNFPAMRVALESGMIDGYVSERPEGVSASMANDNFVVIDFTDGFVTSDDDTAIAVGLRKDSDLRDPINEVLKDISLEDQKKIMDEAIKNQPSAD